MVPIPESSYFPPLENCLSGEQHLISWKTVYTTLSTSDDRPHPHPNLQSFLADEYVLQLLARPYNPYSFTTTQTKSSFETKTAAINVTPTNTERYNINEIKEDALWLGKEAHIDEVSALRLIVLEFQNRSSAQLLCNFSEEEQTSLREAAGNGPEVLATLPTAADTSGSLTTFHSQENRRIRGLRIYLSERRYLLKCAGIFLQIGLDRKRDKSKTSLTEGGSIGSDSSEQTWVHNVGDNVLDAILQSGRSIKDFLIDSIRTIKTSFENLQSGSGWFKQEGGFEELEIGWLGNKLIEAVHTMEIIFGLLDYERNIPSSEPVLEWFKFVATYGFFDQFNSPYSALQPLITPLQSLVSVVSLAMIDPQRSLEFLSYANDSSDSQQDSQTRNAYIIDLSTITELHQILDDAATALSIVGSPAILAWSVILLENRRGSTARKDARELRQSIRAVEEFADDASFDGESPMAGQTRPRRSSTGSEASIEPGIIDRLTESVSANADGDPINRLGISAIDGCHVFDVLTSLSIHFGTFATAKWEAVLASKIRVSILDLTRVGFELVDYSPEIVASALASLSGGLQFWDLLDTVAIPSADDPLSNFLEDDLFVDRLLNASISRYPYESLPFLKIIHAVATSTQHEEGLPLAATILENMESFTFELPDTFRDYETIQEEDNTNAIQITQPIPLFVPNRIKLGRPNGRSFALSRPSEDFGIPAGTQGRIISDSGPKVSVFFHEYNGLKYLGKLLETALAAADVVDATTNASIDRESLAEIINLMATLLLTCSKIKATDNNVNSNAAANRILEQASDGLGRNRDIVSVIFNVFEEELQLQSAATSNDDSLDVLVAAVRFIYALVPILPGRVWPLIGRSELLEIEGRGGKIASIVGRVEIIAGRYDFLISCTHLFDALVEDAVSNAALRRVGVRSVTRFSNNEDFGAGVPEQILSKVLLSFTRAMVDVFEALCTWRFAAEEQRLLLSGRISKVLDDILQYTYGAGDSATETTKLTRPFTGAANHILETYLSTTSGYLRFQPFLRAFLDGFATPDTTIQPQMVSYWIAHARAAAFLTTTVMRLSTILERPTPQLEQHLFKISPLIARLYAIHPNYQSAVIKLLQSIVSSASSHVGEPPSLLGYLGPTTSKNFVQVLFDLGKPLSEDREAISIWQLMTVVIGNRQQWFSIYLLTGRPPRESLRNKSTVGDQPPPRTMMKLALEELSNIHKLSSRKALAILEFVSVAQNFWPWAIGDLHKQSEFIKSISSYVAKMEKTNTSNVVRSLQSTYNCRQAAYIAEILAMYLFHARHVGNTAAAKEILPKISYYTTSAVSSVSYNLSLHANLKRNFESKFPGCSLLDFKKTELESRELGRDYFYDIKFAGKMLRSDQAWRGRKNDGLAEELANANVNLSLVDSQIALLHGWKLLAVELCTGLSGDTNMQSLAAKTVKDCLIVNKESQPSELILARQNQFRADFALLLAQRLVESKSTVKEVDGLLSAVWDTIVDSGSSFETAMTSDELAYYRTLLKLLYLALCLHPGDESSSTKPSGSSSIPQSIEHIARLSPPTIALVMRVIEELVAKGFRNLVAAIQDQDTGIASDDIALVTAILQACLRFPGIGSHHTQIISYMAANDAPRAATTLFSWSDKVVIDGDPVYGELSIHFLLALSSMPQMAEQLAVDGVLGRILSANLSDYMRGLKVGPYADEAGYQRCYSIWARGLLPLLLNILSAVGPTVTTEIALFLNQFPNLLKKSEDALEAPQLGRQSAQVKSISLIQVAEVQSLALLTFALSSFRAQLAGVVAVPEVKWDAAGVLENVEHWLNMRINLRKIIKPLSPRDMELIRQRPTNAADGQFENRLEEEIVEELIGARDILTGETE